MRAALRWHFRAPRTNGRSRTQDPRTGATRRCARGCVGNVCDDASSTSRPCWDAASRPSWTSAPRAGESPHCADWPPGAIAISAITTPWELVLSLEQAHPGQWGPARGEPMIGAADEALHVVQISFFEDVEGTASDRRCSRSGRRWSTSRRGREARGGVHVSVVQACAHRGAAPEHPRRAVPFPAVPREVGQRQLRPARSPICCAVWLRRYRTATASISRGSFWRCLLALARTTPMIAPAGSCQSAAPDLAAPAVATRLLGSERVAFCAREQAQPFVQAGVLGAQTPIYEIPGDPPVALRREITRRHAARDRRLRRPGGSLGRPPRPEQGPANSSGRHQCGNAHVA